jgi:hypothetical protein
MKYLYECPNCHTRYWQEHEECKDNVFIKHTVMWTPDANPSIALSPADTCVCESVFLKDLKELNVCEYTPEQMEQVSYEEYELEDLDGNFIEHVPQMTLRQVTDKAEILCESLHTQVEVWVNAYDENMGPLRDLIYVASCSE